MTRFRVMAPDLVRSSIARAVLGGQGERVEVGDVTLHPHQQAALVRLRHAMTQFGGALLADATGLGKTHVALALIRESNFAMVVAPAALRSMWRTALDRAGCLAPFVSAESLSRGAPPSSALDLVIVDEAHHFRNPGTRRYRALASITRGARVLLLSATPVHNRRRDLETMLGLFLGARAVALDDATIAACVVRRTTGTVQVEHVRMPRVIRHEPMSPPADDAIGELLMSLPPPVLAADEGDAGALVGLLLHRLWSSSDAALRGAVRRRIARAIALGESLASGSIPARAELALWSYGDGALQLAFPELLGASAGTAQETLALRESIAGHQQALEGLLAILPRDSPNDRARADWLRGIRAQHRGERVVAFATFTETVGALWRHLANDSGVCALSAQGARVAGGDLSRDEALARFAPRAHGCVEPRVAERIELLLCTDLLSEGVNLQDASVVVHLDLPWTVARLEQRVGRVARLGSAHDCVHVYSLEAPPLAERALQIRRRLEEKLRTASQARSPARDDERIRQLLASWQNVELAEKVILGEGRQVLVAAVRASIRGVLLAVERGDQVMLVAGIENEPPSREPSRVRKLVEAASGARAPFGEDVHSAVDSALARYEAFVAQRSLLRTDARIASPSSKAALERIASITRDAPPHTRPALHRLATRARNTVLGLRGAGQEMALAAMLADAPHPEEWLQHIVDLGHASYATESRPRLIAALALTE